MTDSYASEIRQEIEELSKYVRRVIWDNDLNEVIKICKKYNVINMPLDAGRYDSYGETMLHVAAEAGSLKIVEFLISKGADPNAMDDCKETPLHYATARKNWGVYDLLVKNGAELFTPDLDKIPQRSPEHARSKM